MNIAVIGGGPIGCYAGYLLASAGQEVAIYENHEQIGVPIQCTGILTADFDEFGLPLNEFLVNTIDTIEVYSPQAGVTVKQKNYIVCRTKFDQYLAKLATGAGAQIYVNHSFSGKINTPQGHQLTIKDTKNNREKRITPDVVIAADGPLSPTAKAYGFYHSHRKNYFGVQATVKGNFAPTIIKTYFGNDICPGLFAWVTPESSTHARVGLATLQNSRYYFDQFIVRYFPDAEIVARQAGTIPLYEPQQVLRHENCYLVGDAASYVKATTLGGIVPALRQVRILVDCITNNKDYEQEIAPVTRQMKMHLLVQRILMKCSDQDFNRLITYVAQPKIRMIFQKYTRDNPLPLVAKTLLREPRFLYFAKYLW